MPGPARARSRSSAAQNCERIYCSVPGAQNCEITVHFENKLNLDLLQNELAYAMGELWKLLKPNGVPVSQSTTSTKAVSPWGDVKINIMADRYVFIFGDETAASFVYNGVKYVRGWLRIPRKEGVLDMGLTRGDWHNHQSDSAKRKFCQEVHPWCLGWIRRNERLLGEVHKGIDRDAILEQRKTLVDWIATCEDRLVLLKDLLKRSLKEDRMLENEETNQAFRGIYNPTS